MLGTVCHPQPVFTEFYTGLNIYYFAWPTPRGLKIQKGCSFQGTWQNKMGGKTKELAKYHKILAEMVLKYHAVK